MPSYGRLGLQQMNLVVEVGGMMHEHPVHNKSLERFFLKLLLLEYN